MLVHCFDCAGLVLSSFFLPPTLCAVDGVYLIANVKLADKQQHSSSLPALFASGMRFLALKKAILFFCFVHVWFKSWSLSLELWICQSPLIGVILS